ncbi:hypothetical protein LJC60_07420 [Ruminococcaceae bacterium OttesenSCG-928-D13]|nr:hypothetical protein [Ruminococcaceae bacterium OttesenSCG-928-D13]
MALRRLPVDVDGIFTVDGRFEPRAMRLYKVHEWLPLVPCGLPVRAANRKVGGAGFRYQVTVMMGLTDGVPIQRKGVLWREGDSWFVEEEVEEDIG